MHVVMLAEVLLPVCVAHAQIGRRHLVGKAREAGTRTGAAAMVVREEIWKRICYVDVDMHWVAAATMLRRVRVILVSVCWPPRPARELWRELVEHLGGHPGHVGMRAAPSRRGPEVRGRRGPELAVRGRGRNLAQSHRARSLGCAPAGTDGRHTHAMAHIGPALMYRPRRSMRGRRSRVTFGGVCVCSPAVSAFSDQSVVSSRIDPQLKDPLDIQSGPTTRRNGKQSSTHLPDWFRVDSGGGGENCCDRRRAR